MSIDYQKLLQGRYEAERLPEDFSPERIVPDFAFNVLNPAGLLYRPVVDENHLQNGGQKPAWPDGKQFAVCLTHDVDAVSAYSPAQSLRAIQKQLIHGGAPIETIKAFLRTGINLARASCKHKTQRRCACIDGGLHIPQTGQATDLDDNVVHSAPSNSGNASDFSGKPNCAG